MKAAIFQRDKRVTNLPVFPAICSCPDFSQRIVLVGALLSWRHLPRGHTSCSRSFDFQGSVSPDKIIFIEKTGPLPYVQNDGKQLEISIFPRLWNHGIMVKNGKIFLMKGGFWMHTKLSIPERLKDLRVVDKRLDTGATGRADRAFQICSQQI